MNHIKNMIVALVNGDEEAAARHFKAQLTMKSSRMFESACDGICLGAKVQPKAHQDGEPFEVVKIVSDDTVTVKDEHGNTKDMLIKDLVVVVKESDDFDDAVGAWKESVKKAYPDVASKLKFKAADGGKTISAEVPGEDRCYGVFDLDSGEGEVLSEGTDK